MKNMKLNNFQKVLIICIGLFILSGLALRFIPSSPKLIAKPYSTLEQSQRLLQEDAIANGTATRNQTAGQTGAPLPTSASFSGSDVLRGLGPNWTFVSQQDQTSQDMSYLDGTVPVRESVARLVADNRIGLDIQESRIVDQKKLAAALKVKDVKRIKVAGKTGYLVPMGGLSGGTALVLTGTSTVLILQDPDAANWPDELNPEVEMYVRTVNVP